MVRHNFRSIISEISLINRKERSSCGYRHVGFSSTKFIIPFEINHSVNQMQMSNRVGYEGLNMMGVCIRRIHGFMVIVIIALSPYNVQMVHSKMYSLGGLYSATTNIIDAANIAYDIRDMLVVSGQVNLLNSVESNETSLTPQDIYNNGKNSGKSLRQMSTESKSIMEGEPLYMFYRYFHDSGDIDGPGDYADKLVTEYFNRNVTWWAHTTDEGKEYI